MTAPLDGLRVALLESQRTDEAAALVRRFGGAPYCVPAVRETRHLDRVAPFIDRLGTGRISAVVFVTGVGATMLLQEAARLGRLDETVAALRKTMVACRGPKPAAVLRRHDIPIRASASEPYTTKELLEAMAQLDLDGRAVGLVWSGEPNRALVEGLASRGAQVEELPLYDWAMPDDLEPLRRLVGDLIEGRVGAIAFTNRIQSRHLLRVAAGLGVADALVEALADRVVVAAIGPVCAETLQSIGVPPDVIPARATMDEMIAALADYVDLTDGLPD